MIALNQAFKADRAAQREARRTFNFQFLTASMKNYYLTRIFGAVFALSFSHLALSNQPDFDFLSLIGIEYARSDKAWCEKNYPEFKEKNDIIFNKSIYSEITSEQFIEANASGELKQKLMSHLPWIRAEKELMDAKKSAKPMREMCSSFEAALGKQNMRGAREKANSELSK